MKKIVILVVLITLFLFSLSGCAPGNRRWNEGNRAGFLMGLWHGVIVIISFIISLFKDNVGIYEVHNTGWTYDLGFLIGLCFSIIGPWKSKNLK